MREIQAQQDLEMAIMMSKQEAEQAKQKVQTAAASEEAKVD